MASLIASIWNKQHLCWRKFMQPAVRMTRVQREWMCQECCVMVGLAHSKFPFPYDTLLMLTFLQLSSSSWKEWGACAEMFGALLRKHSRWVTQNQAFVCCVLVEKRSRPQWYKYYTANVKTLKMCFSWYKRNCYETIWIQMYNHINSCLALLKATIS